MIGPLDFETPMDLVNYLEKLSQDDALYASYFGGRIIMKFVMDPKIGLSLIVICVKD